jgi:hypothetical protein
LVGAARNDTVVRGASSKAEAALFPLISDFVIVDF